MNRIQRRRVLSLLCRRILVAEQPVGRLVLLDGGEAAHRRVEAVIRVVVVALADLSQEDRPAAGLHREVVIQPLLDMDALAGGQADLRPGVDGVGAPIGVDGDVGNLVDTLALQLLILYLMEVCAAAVDDEPRVLFRYLGAADAQSFESRSLDERACKCVLGTFKNTARVWVFERLLIPTGAHVLL